MFTSNGIMLLASSNILPLLLSRVNNTEVILWLVTLKIPLRITSTYTDTWVKDRKFLCSESILPLKSKVMLYIEDVISEYHQVLWNNC